MWLHTVRDNFADGHINRASLPTMRGIGRRFSKIYLSNGGEGEIRTHGPRKGTPVFKTGAFNRSATSPTGNPSTIRLPRHRPGELYATTRAGAAPLPRASMASNAPAPPLQIHSF